MRNVMITGSFDPPTIGHEDIIRRAAENFPAVRVVVFINEEKPAFFPPDTRLAFLKKVCKKYPNVTVDLDRGRVADYAEREGISLIVRAVRGEDDLSYELEMAEYNRKEGGVETLLLPASPSLCTVSSSEVRRRLMASEDPTSLLPFEIGEEIAENWKNLRAKSKNELTNG